MSPPLSFGDGCVTGWAEVGNAGDAMDAWRFLSRCRIPVGANSFAKSRSANRAAFAYWPIAKEFAPTGDFCPADCLMCLNGLSEAFPVLSSLPARMAGSVHEGSS